MDTLDTLGCLAFGAFMLVIGYRVGVLVGADNTRSSLVDLGLLKHDDNGNLIDGDGRLVWIRRQK